MNIYTMTMRDRKMQASRTRYFKTIAGAKAEAEESARAMAHGPIRGPLIWTEDADGYLIGKTDEFNFDWIILTETLGD